METVYIVLYTHQKTKKAKTWQDGTLKVLPTGTKAVLYDDKGSKLDAVHVRASDVVSGEQLESDRYFIQVEERQKQSSHPATQPNTATSASRLTDSQTASRLTSSQTSQRPGAGHSVTSDTRLSPSVGQQGGPGLKRKRTGFIPPRVVRARAEEEETRTTDSGYAGYGLRDSAPSFAAPERTQQHPHPAYTPFGRHGDSQPATSHRAEDGAAGIRNMVEHHQTVEPGSQHRPGLFGTGRAVSASPSTGPGVACMLGRDVRYGSGDGMETSLSSPGSAAPRLASLTTNSPWRTFGSVLTRTSPCLQSPSLAQIAATQQGNLSERVHSSPSFPSHPMSHTATGDQYGDRRLHSSRLLQPESARQVVHATGPGPASDVTSWSQLSPGVTTLDESSCPIASSPTFPSAVSVRPAGQKAYGGNQEASRQYNPNLAHSCSSKPVAKRSASQIMALLGKSQLHTAPVRVSKRELQAKSMSACHSVKMISTDLSSVNSNYQNSLEPADSATTPMALAGVQTKTTFTRSSHDSHSQVDSIEVSCPDEIYESISEKNSLWHSAADGKKLDENSQISIHTDDSLTVSNEQCVSMTGPLPSLSHTSLVIGTVASPRLLPYTRSSLSHLSPNVGSYGTVASPRLTAYTPSLSKHDFEEQEDEVFECESGAATSRQQSQANRDADNSQCLADWDFPVSDLGTQNSQQQLSQTSLTTRISTNCDVAVDRSGNPAVQMQRGENCDDAGQLLHCRKPEPPEDSSFDEALEENTEDDMKPTLTVGTPLAAPEADPKCATKAGEVETAECVDDDNLDGCFDMSLSPLSGDPGSDTDDVENCEQLPGTCDAETDVESLPPSSLVVSRQVVERCDTDGAEDCDQLPVTHQAEREGETLPPISLVASGQVSERCDTGDESGTLWPGKREQSQDETDSPVAVCDVRNACHQHLPPQRQTPEDEKGTNQKNSNGRNKGSMNSGALSVLSCVVKKCVGDDRESPGEQQGTQTLDTVTHSDTVERVTADAVVLNQEEQEKANNVTPQEATQREHGMETGEQTKTTLSGSQTESLPASQSSSNRPAEEQRYHDDIDTQLSEPQAQNTADSASQSGAFDSNSKSLRTHDGSELQAQNTTDSASQAWALDSKSLQPQDNLQDMRTLNDLDISPDSVALYCPSQQLTVPENDDLDSNGSKSQSSRDLSQSAHTQQVLTSQFQQQSLGETEPWVGDEGQNGLYPRESDERNDAKIQSSGHSAYPYPYISSTKLSPFSPTLLALASQSPTYSDASESDRTHLSQSSVASQPYALNFNTEHSVSRQTHLSQSSVVSQSSAQNFNTQHSVCLPVSYKRNTGLEDSSVSKTPRLDYSYSMGGRLSASPHSHSAQENTDPYYQLTGDSQLQLNVSDDIDSCKSSPSAMPVLRGCQTLSEVLGERRRKQQEVGSRNCYSKGPANRQNTVSGIRPRENSSPVGRNGRLSEIEQRQAWGAARNDPSSGTGQRQTWNAGSRNGPSSGIEQRQSWGGGSREEDEEDPMSALQKTRTGRDRLSPDVCQQQQLYDSGSLSASNQRPALSSLTHPDQLIARRGAELTTHSDRPAQAISARMTGYRMQGMVAGSMVERPMARRSQAQVSPTVLTHADWASPVWRGEWLTREGDRGGQPLTGHAAWTPEAQLLSPSGDAVASSERSFFVDWHDGKPCFVNTQHYRQEMQAEHSPGVAQQVPQFADGLTMLKRSPPARQHSDSRLLQVHTPLSLSQNSPATAHSFNHNLEPQDQDFYMSHPTNTQIHSNSVELFEIRNVESCRKVVSHPTQIHSQSVELCEERVVEGYRKDAVKEESSMGVEWAGREDVISVSSDSQPSVSTQQVVSLSQPAPNSIAPSGLHDSLSPQLFSQAPSSFKPRQRDRRLKPVLTAPEDSSQGGGSEVNAAEDSSQGGADVQAEEDVPQGMGNTQPAGEPPMETYITTPVGCVSDAMEADHIELGDFDNSFPESAMLEEGHLEAEGTAPADKVSSNVIALQAEAVPESVITGQRTVSSTQVLSNFSPRQSAAPKTFIADKAEVTSDYALPGQTNKAMPVGERESLAVFPASVAKVDRDRHSVTDRDSTEWWVEDRDRHSVKESSSSENASCASTVSSPGVVVSNQALDCVEEEGQGGRDRGGQGKADRMVRAGHEGQRDPSITGLGQRPLPDGKLQGKASRLLSQIQPLRPPANSLDKENHSTPHSQQRFPAKPLNHHKLSTSLTSDRHNRFQSRKRHQNLTDTVDLLAPSAPTDSPPLDFSPASCTGQSPVIQAKLCHDNQGTFQLPAVHRSFPHTQHYSSSPAPSMKYNHDFRSPAFEGNSASSPSVTEEKKALYAGFSPHDRDVGLKRPTESRSMMAARKVGLGKFKKPAAACFTANVPTSQFQSSLCGELQFYGREDVESHVTPERHVVIPPSFDSVASYRHVLTAALTEFLNIQLFDVAKTYHSALSQVDVSAYTEGASMAGKPASGSSNPACKCGNPSKVAQVKKDGPNKARFFYACSGPRHKQCKFFQWMDQQSSNSSVRGRASVTTVKPKLTDPDSIMGYYRGLKLAVYCQCRFVRRSDDQRFKQGFPAWVRPRQNDSVQKKSIFIRLPKKDSATTHAKDDLWVVSKSLSFVKGETFVARSTFHGPNTHAEVAVEPLAGYSASLWDDGSVCHAIHCGNAATELTCMANLQDHVDLSTLPILPHLLDNQPSSSTASRPGRGFKAPSVTHNSTKLHIPAHFVHELATEFITRYDLNADQASALRQAADMMNKDADPASSLLLIHGVFGAGKSFLLSVLILFLVEVFQRNETYSPGVPFPWKLLLSSTTNVAVDRVLLGLLELGFDDFVRVGSVKKIAKPVLPYSVHAGGSESQELKDLQEMLKSQDITPAEKHCVRKSIERHRLGENRKRLGAVRVVGVTCAACTFHCLHNMQFPFVVLDECSQMTEPASLLPIARFACDKLVLVGDPKQLDPTLQGSSAAHGAGLEQTLFDRLINMGHELVMLRTQYRCHPVISAVSNSLFYHGQLKDGVTTLDRAPILDVFPTMCFYDVSSGQEQTDWSGSYVNEAEAQFVSLLLAVVMARGLQAHSVGVITLYKAQARRIIDILRNYGCDTQCELSGIQVSTVDAFQGGERDVMILSTVRTGSLGFIDSDKRMNVALTRGRHHLLIVGHQRNLHGNKRWAQVISHCQAVEGGITSSVAASRKLQAVLDSVADDNVTEAIDVVTGDLITEMAEDVTDDGVTLTDSGDDAADISSGRRVDVHSGDRTLHSQRTEHVQHASDTQCTHSSPLSHQGSREEGSARYEVDVGKEGGGGGGGGWKSHPSRVKPLVVEEDSESEDGASSDDCLPDGL